MHFVGFYWKTWKTENILPAWFSFPGLFSDRTWGTTSTVCQWWRAWGSTWRWATATLTFPKEASTRWDGCKGIIPHFGNETFLPRVWWEDRFDSLVFIFKACHRSAHWTSAKRQKKIPQIKNCHLQLQLHATCMNSAITVILFCVTLWEMCGVSRSQREDMNTKCRLCKRVQSKYLFWQSPL